MRGFVKWFLIPVALLALGYFVVGPRFGGKVAEKVEAQLPVEQKEPEVKSGPPPSSSPSEPPRKGRAFAPPEVETSVEGQRDRPKSERPRRERENPRTERPKAPAEPPVQPDEAEKDAGGSAGALGDG